MSARVRQCLWPVALLMLTGCGDSATTLLRTAANQKCELTDRLAKVETDADAKEFIDRHMKAYTEKLKNLNDKWDKWIKDTEDGLKERVVSLQANVAPGTPEWEKAMQEYTTKAKDNAQFVATREAFITYMRSVTADEARFKREKTRIADKVKELIEEERAKGGDRTNPNELCPNLYRINEGETFKNVLMTGAVRSVIPGANQ